MESARPAHPCRLLFRCIPWARVSMSNTPSSTHLDKVRKRSQVRWSNNGTGLYSTSCQGNIHPAQIHPKKHRAPTANLLIFGGTAPCQTQRKRFPLPLEPLQKHYSLWDNGVTRASVFNPKKKKKKLTSGFFSHQWLLYSPLASHWLYCWNYCQATIYITLTWALFLPCVNCTRADPQHQRYQAKTWHSFSFIAAAQGWRTGQLRPCMVHFVNRELPCGEEIWAIKKLGQ